MAFTIDDILNNKKFMEKINSAINWHLILNIIVIFITCHKNLKGGNFDIVYYYLCLSHII